MKKYFKKAGLLLMGMLTGHAAIAMHQLTTKSSRPRQLIVVPKDQGSMGTVHKDTMGQFCYYPADSSLWNTTPMGLHIILKAKYEAHKKKSQAAKGTRRRGGQCFPANTLHSLVMAPKLNDKELIENSQNYFGVNGHSNLGYTPLHILISRKDAQVAHVEALLKRGADLNIRSSIRKNHEGNMVQGDDPYSCGIKYQGQSPCNKPVGKFFEGQCHGNKEVMQYVFSLELHKKLRELHKKVKQTERSKYNKAIKYKGQSPANEPVGKFFEHQCDTQVMKCFLWDKLFVKLEKLQEQRGTEMQKAQEELKSVPPYCGQSAVEKTFLVSECVI